MDDLPPQQPTDSNPLSVDMAMDLVGKWETHPGLLMAIFDAARKLRDEVNLLRDDLQRSQDWSNAVASELQTAKHNNERLIEHVKDLNKKRGVMQNDLDHLKDVVAENNASLSSIVMRWIQPSKN